MPELPFPATLSIEKEKHSIIKTNLNSILLTIPTIQNTLEGKLEVNNTQEKVRNK